MGKFLVYFSLSYLHANSGMSLHLIYTRMNNFKLVIVFELKQSNCFSGHSHLALYFLKEKQKANCSFRGCHAPFKNHVFGKQYGDI